MASPEQDCEFSSHQHVEYKDRNSPGVVRPWAGTDSDYYFDDQYRLRCDLFHDSCCPFALVPVGEGNLVERVSPVPPSSCYRRRHELATRPGGLPVDSQKAIQVFSVVLRSPGPSIMQLVEALAESKHIGVKEAHALVKTVPTAVITDATIETALAVQRRFQRIGASVDLLSRVEEEQRLRKILHTILEAAIENALHENSSGNEKRLRAAGVRVESLDEVEERRLIDLIDRGLRAAENYVPYSFRASEHLKDIQPCRHAIWSLADIGSYDAIWRLAGIACLLLDGYIRSGVVEDARQSLRLSKNPLAKLYGTLMTYDSVRETLMEYHGVRQPWKEAGAAVQLVLQYPFLRSELRRLAQRSELDWLARRHLEHDSINQRSIDILLAARLTEMRINQLETAPVGNKVCHTCGNQMPEKARFCTECGTRLL